MRVGTAAVLASGLIAAATIVPASAAPGSLHRAQTRILYARATSVSDFARALPLQLWITDGLGRRARRVLVLRSRFAGDNLLDARLTPSGGIVYAVPSRRDGNDAELFLLERGAAHSRFLFAVRGLRSFAVSPNGQELAYARALPVAGAPIIAVTHLNGSLQRTLTRFDSATLSWSADGRTLFAFSPDPLCAGLCAVTVSSRAIRSIPFPSAQMQGMPSVSPSGGRFAFWNLKGPAGERIYSTEGKFLRNAAGVGGNTAIWSPDEHRLLLQDPGLRVFVFSNHAARPFRHSGPRTLHALDWGALTR